METDELQIASGIGVEQYLAVEAVRIRTEDGQLSAVTGTDAGKTAPTDQQQRRTNHRTNYGTQQKKPADSSSQPAELATQVQS